MAAATSPAPQPAAAPAPAPARSGRSPRPRRLKWIIAAIVVAIAAFFGLRYWHDESLFVTTENAYVQANQVEITAQVGGPILKVYVQDQQQVKAGDPLFDIDPANYELALQRAQAQLEIARQSASQESAGIASAQATLAQRRAEEAQASSDWQRNQELMKSGFLSPQGGQTARTRLATAQAATKAAEADVVRARSALGKSGDENAQVQAAAAAVKTAELDVQRTHVAAPTSGTIANFSLRPGNTVVPSTPLFVLIADQEYWVDANFKETQLKEIRPGQKAEIKSDVYPDRLFHGTVQSVSGGSGAAFSLLPPQNATGNWVKVTQRVPVRIHVDDPDPQHPLRIGTTATVKVRKDG
jgi:membrane fusion protein, multidrug efflux system